MRDARALQSASRHRGFRVWLLALLFAGPAAAVADLQLHSRIDIPRSTGRMDHLAVDLQHRRLYVASLASDAVEVIDLDRLKWSSRLAGLREPQGLAYLPWAGRLYVANGEGASVEAFGDTGRVAVAGDLPDADNLRLDEGIRQLLVGYGAALAVLDPVSLRPLQRMALPGHPEAFAVATRSERIYVNVPSISAVIVLDRRNEVELARWSVAPATRNFPMALDEAGHRLFVATRQPGALQVFDTTGGKRIAEVPLCGDADDLFFDGERQRLYAICGEGVIAVVRWQGEARYEVERRLTSAPGARTGLFVAALKRLFVAAPAREGQPAQVLVYGIQ